MGDDRADRAAGGGQPAVQLQGVAALAPGDEQGLALEGFLTFADRPKADAGTSIARLERLGVQVKIITGDNGLVAAKVCSEIGVECGVC
jgi:Mg2+-importing ATPase